MILKSCIFLHAILIDMYARLSSFFEAANQRRMRLTYMTYRYWNIVMPEIRMHRSDKSHNGLYGSPEIEAVDGLGSWQVLDLWYDYQA